MNKRIIICCDGTWNQPESLESGTSSPTNVISLVRAIKPIASDGKNQVVFYDQGVGTGYTLDKFAGGAFGWGISKNIRDGYQFLCNNYEKGDDIYLFGFSRGSYTARSLSGMIATVGLLDKEYLAHLPKAYAYYRTEPNKRATSKYHNVLKEHIKTPPEIEFIGVWDTVGALGVPTPLLGFISSKIWVGFHDTNVSENIRHAYHALSIDEKRQPFTPDYWTGCKPGQNVQQVWFAGVHSDIGGGYRVRDLSEFTFSWMLEQAGKSGLEFSDNVSSPDNGFEPDPGAKMGDSYKWYYKILELLRYKPYVRPIGAGQLDPDVKPVSLNESLHASVVKRRKQLGDDYCPEHLQQAITDGIPIFESD